MAIISQYACRERTDRIQSFVDEVRRFIYNECFDKQVPVSAIDCFCHDMFAGMNRANAEYSFFELLHLLNSDTFMEEAFVRYYSAIR